LNATSASLARVWLGSFFVAFGCGSPPTPGYVKESDAALTESERGRPMQAAAHYEKAAALAGTARDAEEARYRAAMSYARAGEHARARALLERLASAPGDAEGSVRADFAIADLLRQSGQVDAAEAQLLSAMHRHANSGLARAALLEHLAYVRERGGSELVLSFLDGDGAAFSSTELGEAVLYFRARELERAERTAEARDAYLRCAAAYPYPRGRYWDDALFRAAEMELALGAPDRALSDLEHLLAKRETASVVGSYERSRYDEAQLKIAQIYRDVLHDVARARRELRRVWLEFPKSRLADDALFQEALLARAQQDPAGACEPLRILVRDLRDSRYVGCAELLCPALPRSNLRCHDYIKREAGLSGE